MARHKPATVLFALWSMTLAIVSVDAFSTSSCKHSHPQNRFTTLMAANEDQHSSEEFIWKNVPLNRREAFSRSVSGGAGLFTALYAPADAKNKIANAEEVTSSSSPQSFDSSSLLSQYKPNEFKALPLKGRTTFPPSFVPPFDNRATYRYELGRDAWALEQLLAFANVTATIRTNVVRLKHGGLWVCGPLWPTEEYCALLDELGAVTDVVLPVNALEHKAAMKQFVTKYPNASVWISPGQYGPFGSSGLVTKDMHEKEVQKIVKKASRTMEHRVDGIFPVGSLSMQELGENKVLLPPWIDEFNVETLYVELPVNAGPVSECAFFHKPTKTLFVTDAVICVPSVSNDPLPLSTTTSIQPIFETYFDKATISNPTFWPRTVLQAVFLPLRNTVTIDSTGSEIVTYPGYEALTNRLVRAPILRAFADARSPEAVREWVDRIAGIGSDANVYSGSEEFDRIVTAHFASPIVAGPKQFAGAFAHLLPLDKMGKIVDDDEKRRLIEDMSSTLPPIACQDWSTLDSLNSFIGDNKLGAPVVYDFKIGCKDNDL